MGNIIQINNAVVSSEDRKYLALTDDVIASDSFVDSFLKDHPKCKLRGYPTGMRDEGNQLKSSLKVPRKVSRLVQLFSSRPLHHNSSPEHYQNLTVCWEDFETNSLSLSMNKKGALLVRMHVAYVIHQMDLSKDRQEFSLGLEGSCMLDRSHESFLFETTMHMTLGILKSMGTSNQELFSTLTGSLFAILFKCLAVPAVPTSSAEGQPDSQLVVATRHHFEHYVDGIEAVFLFAEGLYMHVDTTSDNRSTALALMFACSIATSSLRKLLITLDRWRNDCSWNEQFLDPFLVHLQSLNAPPAPLLFPTGFPRLAHELKLSPPQTFLKHVYTSMTTDSSFLYLWRRNNSTLHKIGTGFHRTVLGSEYASREDLLRPFERPCNDDKMSYCNIACLHRQIFLVHEAIGSNRMGVYDCETLLPAKSALNLQLPENKSLQALTSDGLHLFLLQMKFDILDISLTVNVFDPPMVLTDRPISPLHTIELCVSNMPDSLFRLLSDFIRNWRNVSFFCNGYGLVIGLFMPKGNDIAHSYYLQFDLGSGGYLGSSNRLSHKDTLPPSYLSFDRLNNVVWGLTVDTPTLLQWSQKYPPPRTTSWSSPQRLSLGNALGAVFSCVEHRLNYLQNFCLTSTTCSLSNLAQKAHLLCLIDRQNFSYGPPSTSAVGTSASHEIVITAESTRYGFIIRGQSYGTCKNGMNFVILDKYFEPQEFHSFCPSSCKDLRIAKMLTSLAVGTKVLCLIVKVNGQLIDLPTQMALSSIGAKNLHLLDGHSFALIGEKRSPNQHKQSDSAIQSMSAEANGPVELKCKVPSSRSSLWCYGTDASTVHGLVQLVDDHYRYVCSPSDRCQVPSPESATTDQEMMLHMHMMVSALSLLTTSLYQLLQESQLSEATNVLTASDTVFLFRTIEQIISCPPKCDGGDVLADLAARLYATAMNLLLPTVQDKYAAMSTFFKRAHDDDGLSVWESQVFEQILEEISSLRSVSALITASFHESKPRVDSAVATAIMSSLLSFTEMDSSRRLTELESKVGVCSSGISSNNNNKAMVSLNAMLSNVVKICFSQSCQRITAEDDYHDSSYNLDEACSLLLSTFQDTVAASSRILIAASTTASRVKLDERVETILESSVARLLLPTVLTAMSLLLTFHGEKIMTKITTTHWQTIQDCMDAIHIASASGIVSHEFCSSNFVSVVESHWLLKVRSLLVECGGQIARIMIESTSLIKEVEFQHTAWLKSELMAAGYMRPVGELSKEELTEHLFLQGFAEREDNSLSSVFCGIMRHKVREDQGHVSTINGAVYLACAALIKHHGLVSEAMSLAINTGPDAAAQTLAKPSEHLVKVWRAGQALRAFFGLGKGNTDDTSPEDEDEELPSVPPPMLLRGSSVYSEDKDTARVREMTEKVTCRAQYLLRLTAGGVISNDAASMESMTAISNSEADDVLASESTTQAWHALKAEILAESRSSDGVSNAVNMAKPSDSDSRGVSDAVLNFLHGRTDIASLEKVREIRDVRAGIRTQGYTFMTQMLSSVSDVALQNRLLYLCGVGMRKNKTYVGSTSDSPEEHSHVHHFNSIEGCSLAEKLSLQKSFGNFLKQVISIMMNAFKRYQMINSHCHKESIKNTARDDLDETIVCNSLGVLAIDYDVGDHAVLHDINIIDALQRLLRDNVAGNMATSETSKVRSRTWSLVELLATRCLTLEGKTKGIYLSSTTAGPSPFTLEIVALFMHELKILTANQIIPFSPKNSSDKSTKQEESESALNKASIPDGGVTILSSPIKLHPDEPGQCGPCGDMGPQYAVSLWIRRARSPIDDFEECLHTLSPTEDILIASAILEHQLIGSQVIPGPDMKPEDCPPGWSRDVFGIIESYCSETNTALVNFKGDTRRFELGALREGRRFFDVELADVNLSGCIMSNGGLKLFPAIGSDNRPDMAEFNLQVDPTARLCLSTMMSTGKAQVIALGTRIPPDTWTHVAISVIGRDIQVFVNNKLDSKISTAEAIKISEKSFPLYIGQSPGYATSSKVPSMNGFVSGITIFDNRCLTIADVKLLSSSQNRDIFCLPRQTANDYQYLEVLGAVMTNATAFATLSSTFLPDSMASIRIVGPLFSILVSGSNTVQAAALRVCALLLPHYNAMEVNHQAERAGLVTTQSFLLFVFQRVGSMINSFSESKENIKPHSETTMAVDLAYLQLLRALSTSELWAPEVSAHVKRVVDEDLPQVLDALKEGHAREIAREGLVSSLLLMDNKSLESVLGVLGLCGNAVSGFCTGSRARCEAAEVSNDDNCGPGIIEDCTVLGPACPPSGDVIMENSELEKWKDCDGYFGEAVYVCLASQPLVPLLVPRSQILPSRDGGGDDACSQWDLDNFVKSHVTELLALFEMVSQLNSDTHEEQENIQEKVEDKTETTTIQLPIRAMSSCIRVKPTVVSLPRADHVVITYHSASQLPMMSLVCKSLTSPNEIYILDQKNNTCIIHGELFSVITERISAEPSLMTSVSFEATAHFCDNQPKLCVAQLHTRTALNLKLHNLRTLRHVLKCCPWLSRKLIQRPSLISALVDTSLVQIPSITGDSQGSTKSVPIVMESDHPYQNNTSEYFPLKVPGAIELRVVFDKQTATEDGPDFVTFYKNDAHDSYWADHKFYGGHFGNWPGFRKNPEPLIIPADSFVLYWFTDSSATDWGWKLTVTPVFPPGSCSSGADFGDKGDLNSMNMLNCEKLCSMVHSCHLLLKDGVTPLSHQHQLPFDLVDNPTDIEVTPGPSNKASTKIQPMKHDILSKVQYMQSAGLVCSTNSDIEVTSKFLSSGAKKESSPIADKSGDHNADLIDLTSILGAGGNVSTTSRDALALATAVRTAAQVQGLGQTRQQQQQQPIHPMYCVEDLDNGVSSNDSTNQRQRPGHQKQPHPLELMKSRRTHLAQVAVHASQYACVRLAQDCLHDVLAICNSPWSGPTEETGAAGSIENVFVNNQRLLAVLTTFYARYQMTNVAHEDGQEHTPNFAGDDKRGLLDVIKDFVLGNISTASQANVIVGCKTMKNKQLYDDFLCFAVGQLSLLANKENLRLPSILGHTKMIAFNTTNSIESGAASASCGLKEQNNILKCNNGHAMIPVGPNKVPLVYSNTGSNVFANCDICNKKNLHTTGVVTFHCEVCLFDCCGNCGNARLATALLASSTFNTSASTQVSSKSRFDDPSGGLFGAIPSAASSANFSLGAGSKQEGRKKLVRGKKPVAKKGTPGSTSSPVSLTLFSLLPASDTKADPVSDEAIDTDKEEGKLEVEVKEVHRWEVNWPDAKYLHVTFDPSSRIDETVGYVTIETVKKSIMSGNEKEMTSCCQKWHYSGGKLAGVGDEPVCVIPGSYCIVQYHPLHPAVSEENLDIKTQEVAKDSDCAADVNEQQDGSPSKKVVSPADKGKNFVLPVFRLQVYGVVQEPTAEDRVLLALRESATRVSSAELACWVLELLSSCTFNSDLIGQLYSVQTLKSLTGYLTSIEPKVLQSSPALPLIMSLFKQARCLDMSDSVILAMRELGESVISKVTLEQSSEVMSGLNGDVKIRLSQHTQALIQCSVVLGDSLTEMTLSTEEQVQVMQGGIDLWPQSIYLSPDNPPPPAEGKGGVLYLIDRSLMKYLDPAAAKLANLEFSDKLCPRWVDFNILDLNITPLVAYSSLAEVQNDLHKTVMGNLGYFGSGCHTFHVKLDKALNSSTDSHPSVGCMLACGVSNLGEFELGKKSDVTCKSGFSFGWKDKELCVLGGDHMVTVPFGPACVVGDVISVQVDLDKWTVAIARNLVMIGMAIGPLGSGAAVEFDLSVLQAPLHAAASVAQGSCVRLVDVFLPPPLYGVKSPFVMKVPSWLSSIQETVKLLQQFDSANNATSASWRDSVTCSPEELRLACEDAAVAVEQHVSRSMTQTQCFTVQVTPLANAVTITFDTDCCLHDDDVLLIKSLKLNDQGEETTEVVFASVGMQMHDPGPLVNSDGNIVQIAISKTGHWFVYHCGAVASKVQKCTPNNSPCPSCLELRDTRAGKLTCSEGHIMATIPRMSKHPWHACGYAHCSKCRESTAHSPRETYYCNTCVYDLCASCGNELHLEKSEPQISSPFSSSLTAQTSPVQAHPDIAATRVPTLLDAGVCPEGHFMSIIKATEMRTFLCGGCGALRDTSTEVYEYCCRICGYDLCQNCVQSRLSQLGIGLGDVVVRGPSWQKAQKESSVDAETGGLGIVVGFGKWMETPHACVRVQWKDCMSVHRWKYKGESDILVLSKKLKPSSAIVLPGNKFMFEVISALSTKPHADLITIKCTITPVLSPRTIRRQKFLSKPCGPVARARSGSTSSYVNSPQRSRSGTVSMDNSCNMFKHDVALAKYLNGCFGKCDVLTAQWASLAPSEDVLKTLPALKSLMMMEGRDDELIQHSPLNHDETKATGGTDAKDDDKDTKKSAPNFLIESRFKLLKDLNSSLINTLKYFDLCTVLNPQSLAHFLTSRRELIFEPVKLKVFTEVLRSTERICSQFHLKISRPKASRFVATGRVDHDARHMIFSQAFRQVHTKPCYALRSGNQLWNAMFLGERSQDAGGPYSESLSMMMLELQSSSLPLLIRTPNGTHAVGQNREKWLLNPGATSSLHLEMFCFLGKLMGIAVRSKNYLALNIPSIIWKLLVYDTPVMEDLEAIDLHQFQSLNAMRNIHCKGVDRENFSDIFYETFATMSSDQREVELMPGGRDVTVTFDNRLHRCDLVEKHRLHEFDLQASAVSRGLGSVIPRRLLALFTWEQLEVMVCGRPTMDLVLLKSMTAYSSCIEHDEHIQFFWKVMEDFNHEERSVFLRFVWGRSRLPLDAAGFKEARFRIQQFNRSPPDQYMPVAHTCFFSLELPRYSSLEITRDRLRYAIFNCMDIDADGGQGHDSASHWMSDDEEDAVGSGARAQGRGRGGRGREEEE